MLINYKDPFEYRSVSFVEMRESEEDVIYIYNTGSSAETSIPKYYHHDFVSVPICAKFPDIKIEHRTKRFILCRRNVFLAGYRCYIGENRLFNIDDGFSNKNDAFQYFRKFGRPEQFDNELTNLHMDDNKIEFEVGSREVIDISEPVISLTSDEAPNYGSFMIRILPKLIDASFFSNDTKLLIPWYSPSVYDYIRLLGISETRIIRQEVNKIYKLDKVFIPAIRNRDFYLDQESRQFYSNARMRLGSPQAEKKIYISRRAFNEEGLAFHNRRLTNELAVEKLLQEKGFEIISPENLTVPRQIQKFSSASVIVGASGSGLFNTVFSHMGTKLIDIESEPHWYQNHARLFASLKLNFEIFEGNPINNSFETHHIPFSVDLRRLDRRL